MGDEYDYIDTANTNGDTAPDSVLNNLLRAGNVGANIIGALQGKPKTVVQQSGTTNWTPILLIAGGVLVVLLVLGLVLRK